VVHSFKLQDKLAKKTTVKIGKNMTTLSSAGNIGTSNHQSSIINHQSADFKFRLEVQQKPIQVAMVPAVIAGGIAIEEVAKWLAGAGIIAYLGANADQIKKSIADGLASGSETLKGALEMLKTLPAVPSKIKRYATDLLQSMSAISATPPNDKSKAKGLTVNLEGSGAASTECYTEIERRHVGNEKTVKATTTGNIVFTNLLGGQTRTPIMTYTEIADGGKFSPVGTSGLGSSNLKHWVNSTSKIQNLADVKVSGQCSIGLGSFIPAKMIEK
jgi:hypothetical protein